MSAGTRLGAYAAVLAAVFAAAFGLGRVVGPVGPSSSERAPHEQHEVTR